MTKSSVALFLFLGLAALPACSSDSSDPLAVAATDGGATDSGPTDAAKDSNLFHTSDGVPCESLGSKMACQICCAVPTSAAPMRAYLDLVYANCRCANTAPCLNDCSDNFCTGADASTACKECPIMMSDPCEIPTHDSCLADPVCKPYIDCADACLNLP